MTSKATVLAVVIALAVFATACLVGAVLLLITDRQAPGELWTLAGSAIGGLTGLLASTRSTYGPRDLAPPD